MERCVGCVQGGGGERRRIDGRKEDGARGGLLSVCTCPPRSHSLMVTLPLVTLRMLKPTVGIMSSEKPPVATTLTSVVLPEF